MATRTLTPSPTPELTTTPEHSPTPIDQIQGEVEIGVNLPDNAELNQWVFGELAKEGKTIRELENMPTEGRGVRWAFTGEYISILLIETLKAFVPTGVRTIELPGHPCGKLRCFILNAIKNESNIAIPVALDAQDAQSNWTLLLPDVESASPSEVTRWVGEKIFKIVDMIKVINVLTDPTYLDDPSWLDGVPGDEGLRNGIIRDFYVGWGTRDPYDLAINGTSKYRKQNATLERMFTNRAIRLATGDLADRLDDLSQEIGATEVCLYGSNITME